MKKMLSLAAMFAVLAYASPASAELKIGGDFGMRARAEFNSMNPGSDPHDNLYYQYRLRLTGAADLGDGYFFKTLIMNENAANSDAAKFAAGGWKTVGGHYISSSYDNEDGDQPYNLTVSQAYFGRNLKNCNYVVGRIPLNSFNNPIFDLALYPTQPLDTPVSNYGYDRLFGGNYGTKIGGGMLNATFVVLDNASTRVSGSEGNGMLNDGYALNLAYNTTFGNLTVEPEMFIVLNSNDHNAPLTFGANVSSPMGKSKLSGGAFYTTCSNAGYANTDRRDYSGYLLRVKAESGPIMAWFDYNKTTNDLTSKDYTNTFLWAQYKYTVHQSAASTFTLQPTLRWRTAAGITNHSNGNDVVADQSVVRAELWATVSF